MIKIKPIKWGTPGKDWFNKMTANLFKGYRMPDPRDLENEVSDEEKVRIEIESHTHPR